MLRDPTCVCLPSDAAFAHICVITCSYMYMCTCFKLNHPAASLAMFTFCVLLDSAQFLQAYNMVDRLANVPAQLQDSQAYQLSQQIISFP